jgi:hypothetical protein
MMEIENDKIDRIYRLDDETVEQYLERFITFTPYEFVFEYLESEDFRDSLIECSWDCYLDWDYIRDDVFEPAEGWEEYEKREKAYLKYQEEKWSKTEFVRRLLINRFDDLFDVSIKYNEELDKNYHTYTFKYSSYNGDFPYLRILQDVYDYRYTKSYLLDNQPSKINEPHDGISFLLDDFNIWFWEKIYQMGCDEDIFKIISRDESFMDTFEEVLTSEIHYIWDKYHIDMTIFDKIIDEIDESNKISKTPKVWTCYRKECPASWDCETKEEAFDDFLKDDTYGLGDILEHLSTDAPVWLKSILQLY